MEKATSSPLPVTSEKTSTSRPQTSRARTASLPEVDLYIHLLILLYLIDRNSLKSVASLGLARYGSTRSFFCRLGSRLCQTSRG